MTQHEQHEHSLRPYVLVLAALLGLTAITVLAANLDFGNPWSDVVAFAIAFSKASLVVTFFMHVRGSTRMVKLSLWSGLAGVLIFFVLILCDYLKRGGI